MRKNRAVCFTEISQILLSEDKARNRVFSFLRVDLVCIYKRTDGGASSVCVLDAAI